MSHYDDEAQVAELKKWWQENWMALAGGLVLGLAGIFGWEYWQQSQTAKAEQASHLYGDLQKSLDKPDQAKAMGERLVNDFSGTPYAAQGSLLLAQAAAVRKDWAVASGHLRWVIAHSDDPSLVKVAKLRLAAATWQSGEVEPALAQLEIGDDDPFAPLYLELRGDIKLSQNDRDGARAAYQKALELGPAPAVRDLLQRKLSDLTASAS